MRLGAYPLLSVLALVALSACSNGRGSVGEQATGGDPPAPPVLPPETPAPPTPEPPPEEPSPTPEPAPQPGGAALAGYWSGRIAEDDSNRERQGIAFVDRSGDMQVLALRENGEPEFVLHGDVCCESSAEGELAAHRYLSTRDEAAKLEASSTNGGFLGRFEFRDRNYEFNLQPDAAYLRPLTLQSLAGVYTRTVSAGLSGPETMTLTIDPSGALTGSHSNGCILSGSATIPDPARNMARLNVELSSCGGESSSRRWNGSYRGFGILLRDAPSPSDDTTRTDLFYCSLVGPTWLGPMTFER